MFERKDDSQLQLVGRDWKTKPPRFLLQQELRSIADRILNFIVVVVVVMALLVYMTHNVKQTEAVVFATEECASSFERYGMDSPQYKAAWSTCYQDVRTAVVGR